LLRAAVAMANRTMADRMRFISVIPLERIAAIL
jgi:hypothetical protein